MLSHAIVAVTSLTPLLGITEAMSVNAERQIGRYYRGEVSPRRFSGLILAAAALALPACVSNPTERAASSTTTEPLRTISMTNVQISGTDAATFEQIHPLPGPMTLTTTATTELLACPGGWGGLVTRSGKGSWGSLWLGEDCIPFSTSAPATLPTVTISQHYAIAVVVATGATTVPELRLTYRAADESQMCFVALVERPCR